MAWSGNLFFKILNYLLNIFKGLYGGLVIALGSESVAKRNALKIRQISSKSVTLTDLLRGMDFDGWRREGNELVDWIQREAGDMESSEKNVAITKAVGGGVSMVGEVLSAVSAIAGPMSEFWVKLVGLSVSWAGAATSLGGEAAKRSIAHMKTCEIKKRYEKFVQRSESIVSVLEQLERLTTELSELCEEIKQQQQHSAINAFGSKSNTSVYDLVGADLVSKMVVAGEISQQERRAIVFGADFVKRFDAGKDVAEICGSLVSQAFRGQAIVKGVEAVKVFCSTGKRAPKGKTVLGVEEVAKIATAVVGGAAMGDVSECASTFQSGGCHAKLMREEASRLSNDVKEIENILRKHRLLD